MNYKILLIICGLCCLTISAQAEYYGQYTVNRFAPNSVANPYGQYGNPYGANSINNPFNRGNINPITGFSGDGKTYKLYDSEGNFRGNLNNNPYDPDSIANPHGRYGSQYSAESINNPYGAGNRHRNDSPFNEFGNGMEIRFE